MHFFVKKVMELLRLASESAAGDDHKAMLSWTAELRTVIVDVKPLFREGQRRFIRTTPRWSMIEETAHATLFRRTAELLAIVDPAGLKGLETAAVNVESAKVLADSAELLEPLTADVKRKYERLIPAWQRVWWGL
jgi:hypothetical protein